MEVTSKKISDLQYKMFTSVQKYADWDLNKKKKHIKKMQKRLVKIKINMIYKTLNNLKHILDV
jgi:hypothetical protein